jgi:hypothetical protein
MQVGQSNILDRPAYLFGRPTCLLGQLTYLLFGPVNKLTEQRDKVGPTHLLTALSKVTSELVKQRKLPHLIGLAQLFWPIKPRHLAWSMDIVGRPRQDDWPVKPTLLGRPTNCMSWPIKCLTSQTEKLVPTRVLNGQALLLNWLVKPSQLTRPAI